jgi:hypothetical protein
MQGTDYILKVNANIFPYFCFQTLIYEHTPDTDTENNPGPPGFDSLWENFLTGGYPGHVQAG